VKIMVFLVLGLLVAGFLVGIAEAQEGSRKVERITIPYTAANADRRSPEYHSFQSKHMGDWILTISNELAYNPENPDAKVVLRLKEDPASERYIELAMFGDPSRTFVVALDNEQGYSQLFESEQGWIEDREVRLSYIANERLSVANGQRNVLDKLRVGSMIVGTVEVYGRDLVDAPASAAGGEIVLDIVSGNPMENPVMLTPLILLGVVGGVVLTLLKVKKRT
jgi:hypothetical protein